MSFDYFYGQQSDLFTFYRVPKVLFTNERFWNISADAKMLYGILLDRMSLSAKNGWIDKNGRVYIIFTIDEAKMALNCAEQKAIKLLSELEKKAGLIERKRQGLGKPNLIYVKNFISAVDARNKNVLIIGGSGSGKTRFWLKPNLLQMHSSYVVTDPKGSIVIECGNALLKHGYTIKIFNTINFQKSMHYNPFAYIHSEKDILKLVTTLIANTKGDGKAGDEFWTKAETLLYCALIGYIHYEAPVEEQNFSTLIEFLNAMEVREDDEEFQNPVDLMFEALEKKKPNHFAVRQYKKYKLAAGDVCSK